MNKFGIFNLINSFYDLYKNSSPAEREEKNSAPEKPDALGVVSSLLKNLAPQPSSQKTEHDSKPSKTKSAPLQLGMISAMRSHDDFVKKVNAKQKEKV